MKNNQPLVRLKPEYQKSIFEKVIRKYGSSFKASRSINIPASSIRGYKNLYFDSLPLYLLLDIAKKLDIPKKEIKTNTISVFDRREQFENSLDEGRKIRKQKLKQMQLAIPEPKKIISRNNLVIEKWLRYYIPLSSIGCRQITLESEQNYVLASYKNYTKEGFKHFTKKIPKTLAIDDDFMYFFGLWCGDRAGGKRFGICNKNAIIISYTEDLLKKCGQNVEKILYIQKSLSIPEVPFDKKFVIDKDIKGWVISVHATNGILSSFFHYLQSNIYFLLEHYNKYAFFAGLFDAEGNVSLYNKSFRWACKNEKYIKCYTKFLKKLNLYRSYDGKCLITYNKDTFYEKIFPYMKHSDKVNSVKLLCRGEGYLLKEHTEILNYLFESPGKTAKEISKALKKRKVYSELRILSDFGFVSHTGYPHAFQATPKGLKSLGENTPL